MTAVMQETEIGEHEGLSAGHDSWQQKLHKSAAQQEDIMREREMKKAHIASDMKGLYASASIAIAQLQAASSKKPSRSHGSDKLISQFEDVQSAASGILSALETPGSARLGELMRKSTLISSSLREDNDSASDAEEADKSAPAARVIAPAVDNAVVDEDPLMQMLFMRRASLLALRAHHQELQDNAAACVNDAQTDLLAAANLASEMFAHKNAGEDFTQSEEFGKFLNQVQAGMIEAAKTSGASDVALEARLQMIVDMAAKISEGMAAGNNEAAESLLTAGEQFIALHLNKHRGQGIHHFETAGKHLAEYLAPDQLVEFKKGADEWLNRLDETGDIMAAQFRQARAALNDNMQASPKTLSELMEAAGMNDIMGSLHEMQKENARAFSRHEHLYRQASENTEQALHGMSKLLHGDVSRSDIKHLAHLSGMDEKSIAAGVARFYEDNGLAEAAHHGRAHMRRQIDHINEGWSSLHHDSQQAHRLPPRKA